MKIKVELTNEPHNIRIFEEITLEGFKKLLKDDPGSVIKFLEDMEEKINRGKVDHMIGDCEYWMEVDGKMKLVATSEMFRISQDNEELYSKAFLRDVNDGKIKGIKKQVV